MLLRQLHSRILHGSFNLATLHRSHGVSSVVHWIFDLLILNGCALLLIIQSLLDGHFQLAQHRSSILRVFVILCIIHSSLVIIVLDRICSSFIVIILEGISCFSSGFFVVIINDRLFGVLSRLLVIIIFDSICRGFVIVVLHSCAVLAELLLD